MTQSRRIWLCLASFACLTSPAAAQTSPPATHFTMSFAPAAPASPASGVKSVRFDDAAGVSPEVRPARATPVPSQGPPPAAIEYSDAYYVRARIHRIASFATLPLFATEAIIGQSLYAATTPSRGQRTAHGVVAGAIAGLFGVNTVTGVWNLLEARHDPEGRGRRLAHGILMLAADAGFLATAMLAPEREHGRLGPVVYERSPATHRAVAFASIGTASAGYLLMLFGGR